MPRVSDVYNYPPGTPGVPDNTIESIDYNTYIDDIKDDLNFPRPILAGGTGASDAINALNNLGGEKAKQIVTNYDGFPTGQTSWLSGSFYSAAGASGAPTANAFVGFVSVQDANNMVLEACDLTDAAHPVYLRAKVSGAWSAWIKQVAFTDVSAGLAGKVDRTGDTMTGHLSLPTGPAAANAVRKDYVDAADALKADKIYVDEADALKAPIDSPTFTGDPKAPTPTAGDNDTTIATTAFVANAAQSKVAKAGDTMTGPLILDADPSSGLGAATKQYVDARYQRIALAGLVQSDVTVPTGAVAARLIGTLYPLNTDAYPLLQLSVAPGVFRNTANDYVLNGFQHSVTSTPTAVTPLTNVNTLPGMLLCVANSTTAAISFIFTATVVLKRPNTSAVFTCDAQGVAFVGGVNNHSFFHNYMGAGAVSGSALSILALRIVNGVGEVWGNESYVNVEWL